MNSKSVKTIQRVGRPRPLRTSIDCGKPADIKNDLSTPRKPLSDVLPELEELYRNIRNSNFDEKTGENVSRICQIFKIYGQEMDMSMKNMVDHYFVTLRNISREDRLDAVSRLRLLKVIELKAMGWQSNENIVNYYHRKIAELEGTEKTPVTLSTSHSCSSLLSSQTFPEQTPSIGVPLAPGEIMRSSGKFMNPTKIAGKNYYKDEVVIRNSDSGKVMGIKGRRVHMIEELSDTIISFQRVNPGARDRRVQIAGPNEESISHAKTLVEDTIRRNASPIRAPDANSNIDIKDCINASNVNQEVLSNMLTHSLSMGDASSNQYSLNVEFMGQTIRVLGDDLETLKQAKSCLEENFYGSQLPILSSRGSAHLDNMPKLDFKQPRHDLQRSLSWLGSLGSRASISPFDSSSEDDAFKDSDTNFKSLPSDESPAFSFELSNDVDNTPTIPPPAPAPLKKVYHREFLLHCRKSPLCKTDPQLSPEIVATYPMIVRENSQSQSTHSSYQENLKPDDNTT